MGGGGSFIPPATGGGDGEAGDPSLAAAPKRLGGPPLKGAGAGSDVELLLDDDGVALRWEPSVGYARTEMRLDLRGLKVGMRLRGAENEEVSSSSLFCKGGNWSWSSSCSRTALFLEGSMGGALASECDELESWVAKMDLLRSGWAWS
jgi:hypothetical protein